MELRLTVHVPQRRTRPVDVVIDAREGAAAGRLRGALADHLGLPVPVLSVEGRPVADDAVVGMPPLLDGASVTVEGTEALRGGGADGGGNRPRAVLEVAVVGGPDAGRSRPLGPGGTDVGRSPDTGLRLEDPALSRRHARFTVDADGVAVEDTGSTNGVVVDGRPVDGAQRVDTASTIVIGASTLRLRRVAPPGLPVVHPGDGTVLLAPGRRPVASPPAVEVEAPRAPTEPTRARVPWVAALVPVPVFAAMAFFLGPHLLAFALLGPVVVLATALTDRVGARRRHRAALADHARATAEARSRFESALAEERRMRERVHPDLHEVLRRAEHRLAGLWSAPDDLRVRVGIGTVPATTTWRDGSEVERGEAVAVPVVVDLAEGHVLGVVGPQGETRALLTGVVGQLVVRCPPSALGVEVLGPPDDAWRWLGLLPHPPRAARRLVVVPDAAGAGSSVTETGDDTLLLVAAERREELPDGCGAVLECLGGGRHVLHHTGGPTPLVADGAGPAWAERVARALAPVRLGGSGGAAALPRAVGLTSLLDHPLDVAGVQRGWAASDGPVAAVGVRDGGTFRLDLRADGPHVLVGGTTGSGKSEFLRTLVTGLALGSPPEQLTMLLVDFKGGAAFGPCATLPHVVGLVTDLDDHLAGRVLRSLGAELRRRERVLGDSGASDLDDHHARPGAEPLPRLVVVVDEVRALVDELPDLVSGLVRLAAQGRSLGIHLVLATQRPSGTLTPEIQANVNLRVAFRVRDRADSVGVVEDAAAADLPADTPGRGLARGGDGRLVAFQVALVAPESAGPPVTVRPQGTDRATSDRDRAAETAAVVDVVRSAHDDRGGTAPRRPWLPPLPEALEPASLGPSGLAVVDEPERQRRVTLSWSRDVALWRVVGRPRSGRTTALSAVVRAATSEMPPGDLHVHAVAPDTPAWAGLPHVGTVAAPHDTAAVRALLSHLESVVGDASAEASRGRTVLLVVDGWEQLAEHDDPRDATPSSERLLRLLRDGAGRGLVAAVCGGRDLLRSAWSALGGRTLVLGTPDPLDAALLGLPAGVLSPDAPPGRGLLAADGRELQVARPSERDWARRGRRPVTPDAAPWRYRALPTRVTRLDIAPEHRPRDGLLLGLAGPTAGAWAWQPAVHGRRLLVAGPPRSGRTTALATLAASATAADRPVAVVSPTTGPGRWPCPVLGPDDADTLVTLRREHPEMVLLVDDADRLSDSAVLPVVAEIAALVDRDHGAVAVATTTSGLLGRFRGLDVDVARHGTGVLLRPARHDGDLLGVARVDVPAVQGLPGRGVVVVDGVASALQVLADQPEPAPAGR
ncbi:FHA domain-containing protein [Phycicoccus sp. CSK15P-2]|uniref:FtsK/SpoIIIE domain-containing protein n=1 Tax=Phycicoccus sp. CSK15P-2 TaxID=2807627 RepID=UPI00195084DC|nr:FtsK/SpoIIIE domain-containing protein [Phycicoccus sp. CSK15P-2]MBM6404376.1 FHA domain-containing protein [Phycicoccus sp. CSK15P-2]